MADQQNPGAVTNTFTKGMVKDYNDTFIGEGLWTHARNAVNNSHDGQVGVIGNEPANLHCVTLPYTLIGAIHLTDDQWAIFTTDDTHSEIGVFDESACSYTTKINASCLNFKRSHLITGVSRRRFGCESLVYWDDGLNPSRVINLDEIPYYTTSVTTGTCTVVTPTNILNCEKLRLAPLVQPPCINLAKGKSVGTLPNGSYQVTIAYAINGVVIGDYAVPSEVQSLFDHNNLTGSLKMDISNIDLNFDQYQLVIIYYANGQLTVKQLGFYSVEQTTVYIDTVDPSLPTIPIEKIPVSNPVYEKSDGMYRVNDYILRVGLYSRFEFNYQPQANAIKTKWVAIQYPADYYHKGGNNPSYMRDEQYAFFIRWIYNTGDKSASYHIPGRAPLASDLQLDMGEDAIETLNGQTVARWQTHNTATITSLVQSSTSDGGTIIAEGQMGYWESTEKYPNESPAVWGTLCGANIRHHKFPDSSTDPLVNHFNSDGKNIVVLGVKFENISHPLGADGLPIESVVGYEILRGSREGQKSIVAKGMFNNMREFDIPDRPQLKGLYQNYPYNDLREDYFLTSDKGINDQGSFNNRRNAPLTKYKKDIFSFHSPETTFSKPFLSISEVKLYQQLSGTAIGYFENPYKHPKAKVLGQGAEIITKVLAVLDLFSKLNFLTGDTAPKLSTTGTQNIPFTVDITPTKPDPNQHSLVGSIVGGIASLISPGAGTAAQLIADKIMYYANMAEYVVKVAMVSYVTTEVTNAQLTLLVYGLLPKKQYAAQYNSHGFYNISAPIALTGNTRRAVVNSYYVDNNLQSFTADYVINNLYRPNSVVIQVHKDIADPSIKDESRNTLSTLGVGLNVNTSKNISAYYGAIKTNLPSQYGQIDSIVQIPTFTCVQKTSPIASNRYTSPVVFGGDTYINRFTEKNVFPLFNDWMFNLEDEFEYDYRESANIPYPRYWLDSSKVEYKLLKSSSNYHHLDDGKKDNGFFYQKPGHFYISCNGVRDFFVESEINLAQRDWGENLSQRHYDPYLFTDTSTLFRSDILKSSNFYKYDYSLSISKLFIQQYFKGWGNVLPRDYDPILYNKCFTYIPNRVAYSLSQTMENKKDYWRVFLPNNYKDFASSVTAIKAINKSGALFMMKYESPLEFAGVDELQTQGGLKVTVGDGGLFNQPLRSLVNAEETFEYASNQGRFSSIGTTHGVFWISQNQGKIFQYSGQLDEISRNGMKWWFAKYLPSELLAAFPTYPLYDNPVKGVGTFLSYDNTNEILYVTKKDYKPKIDNLAFDSEGRFYTIVNGVKAYHELTDSLIFEDASWTVSYDPKTKAWVSFHDWHPSYVIPGKSHMMTVNQDSIWKHNIRCDLYCNFYGVDHPFDIEYVSATGQTITSMRSIEYMLEAYQMHNNCRDKYHVLDANFDYAMIHNSEQISGLLELYLKEKNNPIAQLAFPKVTPTSIKINFSKEENKYRFNQFWDITKNRGEFVTVNTPMFITKANGYDYGINPDYINYDKSVLERKKFRHSINRVWLRKLVSGDTKLLFKISNQKILQSPR